MSCQILTNFQNFCTAGKRVKLATKLIRQYPPHLRYVAILPWEIKNSNFLSIFSRYGRKCTQIVYLSPLTASHPQILIFSVFKIAICSPYWLQIKFSKSLFFYMFTSAINSWHRTFTTQQTSLQCLSTINMVYSNEDKILIKTHKYTQHTQLLTV